MSSHADTITDEQLREWTGYGGQSIVLAAQAALDARAENQRLREALRRISDYGPMPLEVRRIANHALAAVGEE